MVLCEPLHNMSHTFQSQELCYLLEYIQHVVIIRVLLQLVNMCLINVTSTQFLQFCLSHTRKESDCLTLIVLHGFHSSNRASRENNLELMDLASMV